MKQTTKILGLGILFLFLASMQLSAQKCKYDFNKKDPLTDEVTKGISFNVSNETKYFGGASNVGKAFKTKIGINKIGEKYFLSLDIFLVGNVREYISKGEPFTIKLSNGETITATAQEEILPTQIANQNGVYTQYIAKYDIDAASIEKLAEFSPTFYRINFGSRTSDKEISSGEQKKFTEAAKCILQ